MKRYVLFGGETYYPTGGMNDFIDSFDQLEVAVDFAKKLELAGKYHSLEWWHVLDCNDFSIVATSEFQGYGTACDCPPMKTPDWILKLIELIESEQ